MSFAILFLLSALWSLASPLFSVADEPAHAVRAAAVVRGQLGGPESREFVDRQVRSTVRVPALFGTATSLPVCYLGMHDVPASCAPAFGGPTELRPTLTQVGRYPPAYYFVVGLPTLAFPSGFGVHLMRLITAAIASALLASAFASVRARGRDGVGPLLVGAAVAVTPMALFFAGSVNPSGIEIASAVGLWASLCALFLSGDSESTTRLVVRAAVAGSILALARQLGPLWVPLIVLAVLACADPARRRALWARSDVRRGAAAVAVALVLAGIWIVARDTLGGLGGTPPPEPLSLRQVVQASLGNTPDDVLQMIGKFGWTDLRAPIVTYYAWFACLGFLGIAALAHGSRRQIEVLLGLLALVVLVPVVFESSKAREIGFVWLGRYILPLAVGIPLLSAVMASGLLRGSARRLVWVVACLVAAAHFVAFAFTLRRYTGSISPLGKGEWSPPGSIPVLLVGHAAGCAAYVWWLQRLGTAPPAAQTAVGEGGPSSAGSSSYPT